MKTVSDLGEQALIRELAAVFDVPDDDVDVAIGDDAAIARLGPRVCATVDSIEASVDWLVRHTPRDAIGHRAAAVNLSDLAAMGARPRCLLLALEVPPTQRIDEVVQSATAMHKLAQANGALVIGGDLSVGPIERWTVTALGAMEGRPLLRSAAQPGDLLWLIGEVGMASIGLFALQNELDDDAFAHCIERHLRPTPQCARGLALSARDQRIGAIDVSDGLLADARKMAAASQARFHLTLSRPRWLTARLNAVIDTHQIDWRYRCATGGDDYALLVSTPANVTLAAQQVGYVSDGRGVSLVVDQVPIRDAVGGWEHR